MVVTQVRGFLIQPLWILLVVYKSKPPSIYMEANTKDMGSCLHPSWIRSERAAWPSTWQVITTRTFKSTRKNLQLLPVNRWAVEHRQRDHNCKPDKKIYKTQHRCDFYRQWKKIMGSFFCSKTWYIRKLKDHQKALIEEDISYKMHSGFNWNLSF